MKFLSRFVFVMLLLATANSWAANEGKKQLDGFLAKLTTLQSEFVQSLVDANGKVLDESEGVMQIARPGKFRLEYTSGSNNQLYVADGNKVWVYDRDLAQVTVKKQDEALGSTPALLLSSTAPIEKNFRVKELGFHEGFQWLELKPLKSEGSFEYVRLAMEGNVLRAMEMIDGFGQTTRLYFKTLQRNPKLADTLFRFTPPKDVDVVGDVK
ncbi:MAG TPA: outer membrane lipoprotein chaperone LolA [Gammaproteobacteria bacterium]